MNKNRFFSSLFLLAFVFGFVASASGQNVAKSADVTQTAVEAGMLRTSIPEVTPSLDAKVSIGLDFYQSVMLPGLFSRPSGTGSYVWLEIYSPSLQVIEIYVITSEGQVKKSSFFAEGSLPMEVSFGGKHVDYTIEVRFAERGAANAKIWATGYTTPLQITGQGHFWCECGATKGQPVEQRRK